MNSGNNYLNMNINDIYYNMDIKKAQDMDYDLQENYEEMTNPENSDNLLEKMENTLDTFLNNLKKDDIPSYPNFNQPKNINTKNLIEIINIIILN